MKFRFVFINDALISKYGQFQFIYFKFIYWIDGLGRNKYQSDHSNDMVSVVIATRNNDRFIENSIESLRVQTHSDLEIIVVNDASTDRTSEILGRLSEADSRIRVITNLERRGTGYARNLGLRASKGRYVTFQDGDDVSHPNRIAIQLAALQMFPSKVIVVCSYKRVDAYGRSIWINGQLIKKCIVSMMFRREPVIREVGYFFNGSLGEDTDFFERVKLAFGQRSAIRIWKVLYFALFQTGSSFFSSVNVWRSGSRHIQYERTADGLETYRRLQDRHARMKRNELSVYEEFVEIP